MAPNICGSLCNMVSPFGAYIFEVACRFLENLYVAILIELQYSPGFKVLDIAVNFCSLVIVIQVQVICKII